MIFIKILSSFKKYEKPNKRPSSEVRIRTMSDLKEVWLRLVISINWKLEKHYGPTLNMEGQYRLFCARLICLQHKLKLHGKGIAILQQLRQRKSIIIKPISPNRM